MASPQVENGHIDIANELAEALARIRISGEEYQVLWVILRKTYGWHKKQDAISLSQFVEMTGIVKPHVIRALNNLLPKKVITITNNGNEPAKVYGINKNYDQWLALPKKVTLPKKVIKVTNNGNTSLPILGTTKETTTKEKKETISVPDFISKKTWIDFIQHRKLLKSPPSQQACKLIFKKLEKWKNENGWSPDDILNQSIEKGWKGIFELREHRNGSGNKPHQPTSRKMVSVDDIRKEQRRIQNGSARQPQNSIEGE